VLRPSVDGTTPKPPWCGAAEATSIWPGGRQRLVVERRPGNCVKLITFSPLPSESAAKSSLCPRTGLERWRAFMSSEGIAFEALAAHREVERCQQVAQPAVDGVVPSW
jgi:hypothetical protein